MSFKDEVVGKELDLSLNGLAEVPVKELANTPKATHLDLSCNRIQTLPSDFATLTHLVKIDLGRNNLRELPHNFGNLLNLQHLDLDKNELRDIPLSFCRLKNLRWLDLKDNPLDPKLKSVAGDCLDEKQCQNCAKNVVMYMQNLESNKEREKQKKLKEKREKEAVENARVEKELEQKRKQRKLEKERRKAQTKIKNDDKLKDDVEITEKENHFVGTDSKDVIYEKSKGMHWCMWFLPLVSIILAIVIYFFVTHKGIYFKDISFKDISLSDVKTMSLTYALNFIKTSIKFWHTSVTPYIVYFKVSLLRNIHSIMIYISNVASRIELLLSVYF